MCRKGTRVVRDEVLARTADERLRVYAVWMRYRKGDEPAVAREAMATLADHRIRHFWLPSRSIGERFARVLKLPGRQKVAWDVYLVYEGDAAWASDAPRPADWMHQLSKDARCLEGGALAGVVRRLLRDLDA